MYKLYRYRDQHPGRWWDGVRGWGTDSEWPTPHRHREKNGPGQKDCQEKEEKEKVSLMSLRDNYINRTIWGYMPISAHAWIISHLHLSNLIWKSQLVYREFLWSFELYTVVCTVMYVTFLMVKSLIIISTLVHL